MDPKRHMTRSHDHPVLNLMVDMAYCMKLCRCATHMTIFLWSRHVSCSKISLSAIPNTRTAPT